MNEPEKVDVVIFRENTRTLRGNRMEGRLGERKSLRYLRKESRARSREIGDRHQAVSEFGPSA